MRVKIGNEIMEANRVLLDDKNSITFSVITHLGAMVPTEVKLCVIECKEREDAEGWLNFVNREGYVDLTDDMNGEKGRRVTRIWNSSNNNE